MSSFILNLLGLDPRASIERKSTPLVPHSEEYIESRIAAEDTAGFVSVAYACARVIAEGLAQPPMYLQQVTKGGRRFADEHPLYPILNTVPNKLQTSGELRTVMGWQASTTGDSYAWINRARGTREILEIVPLKPSEVSRIDSVVPGALPTFTMGGKTMRPDEIWHFKGPSADRDGGINTMGAASRAVQMAAVAETFGIDLFKNRAALEGIISPTGAMDQTQLDRLKASFKEQHQDGGRKGRTAFFPLGINYQPLSSTATDAQWLETRRYQIEEICRYFRVSPIKVFSSLGSQSYASVEQAHIAHDADTDAHWHERFAASATKNLLSFEDRRAGYRVVIDNRAALRGTAKERAEYYNLGLQGGWLTQNEAREAEGYDRSSDPEADKLKPAANLFGKPPEGSSPKPSE